jgi:internalin A
MSRPISKTEQALIQKLEEEIGVPLTQLVARAPSDGRHSDIFMAHRRGPVYQLDRRGRVVGISLQNLLDTPIGPDPSGYQYKKLSKIPVSINDFKYLKNLDLRFNEIQEIPMGIFDAGVSVTLDWETYPSITVGHNPIQSPPLEIIDRGAAAVAEYFKALEEGVVQLNEVKVLLVGDGGAGKTSLIRRLFDEEFNAGEPQTHGINIRSSVICEEPSALKANFWDFGGQDIMHATHQFFLSSRSLYLMVLDGRREERAEYWLQLVKTFGGDSPIVVVMNKIDENPSYDLNRSFLQDKYPAIRSFHRVSCASGEGLQELHEAIISAVNEVEIVNSEWSPSWLAVKTALEELNEPFIAHEQYEQICNEAGVESEAQRETLLDFLNDLGVALYFADFELSGMQVLNPLWVTAGVYKIINSEILANGEGELSLRDIQRIFQDQASRYPAEARRYLVDLMRKFELCYQLTGSAVLVPDLLPVQQPKTGDFSATNDVLRLVLEYEFLPASVLPRLMVRMNTDVDQRWRTGMVLRNELFGTQALLRADKEASQIEVSVRGGQRREYCAVLMATFSMIHRSYDGLRWKEFVMAPDGSDAKVSYSHLLTLEAHGIADYMPEGSAKSYAVAELLGQVRTNAGSMGEALEILRKMQSEADDEEMLRRKANEVVMLQPNFFGVGVNVNALIDRFLKKNGPKKP